MFCETGLLCLLYIYRLKTLHRLYIITPILETHSFHRCLYTVVGAPWGAHMSLSRKLSSTFTVSSEHIVPLDFGERSIKLWKHFYKQVYTRNINNVQAFKSK